MKLNKHIFFKFLSVKWMQPLFEMLYKVALRGMNYGAAAYDLSYSGEYFFLGELRKLIPQDCVILDIGAHKGNYAKKLLETFTKANAIYSFEPTKASYEILRNVSNANNFHAIKAAMGTEVSTIKLGYARQGSVLTSAFYESNMEVEEVQCSTIDTFCKEHNIEKIDFLKIDVEGFELMVLKGAEETLKNKKIKVIQFEFGNHQLRAHHTLRDFFSILIDYNLYRVVQNGIYPITYNDLFEIYQVTNYVAILKE